MVTLKIPIMYGTISTSRRKTGEGYDFNWIAFMKHPDNINLNFIIDNVRFVLHETFKKPV